MKTVRIDNMTWELLVQLKLNRKQKTMDAVIRQLILAASKTSKPEIKTEPEIKYEIIPNASEDEIKNAERFDAEAE